MKPKANPIYKIGIVGPTTLTCGMAIYVDTANGNVIKPADANLSALSATVGGIIVAGGVTGQVCVYQVSGDLTIGATTGTVLAAGQSLILSATNSVGALAPAADLTTGWNLSRIGYGLNATDIRLEIKNTGVVSA